MPRRDSSADVETSDAESSSSSSSGDDVVPPAAPSSPWRSRKTRLAGTGTGIGTGTGTGPGPGPGPGPGSSSSDKENAMSGGIRHSNHGSSNGNNGGSNSGINNSSSSNKSTRTSSTTAATSAAAAAAAASPFGRGALREHEEPPNGTQALHREVLDEEGDLSVYDPDQPAAERRQIRREYRNLQRELDERKSDFLRPDNDGLLKTFHEADELYKNVKQTADATMDSRLLVAASDLTLKKVSNMVVGSSGVGIDVDEFVGKCISFMKNADRGAAAQAAPVHDEDDDDDEDGDAMDWAFLGRAAAFRSSRRAATSDFLLGPLSVQRKVRVQKTRRQGLRRGKNEKAAEPTNVRAEDIKTSENNTLVLVRKVQAILKAYLEDHDLEDLPLMRAVINPHSFSQTVENIFFLSFLAKEGMCSVYEHEDTGLPVLVLTEPATASQRDTGEARRNQMIFSITMWEWKQCIEVFDIRDSIIPTRAKEVATVGATGWYT